MKTILVPIDSPRQQANAIWYAVDLQKKTGAKILLHHSFHIVLPHTEDAVYGRSPLLAEAKEACIEKLRAALDELGVNSSYDISLLADVGDPVANIIEASAQFKPSLILMGTQGAHGFKEIIGSNTYYIMRHVKCPVMAVPLENGFKDIKKIAFAFDYQPLKNNAVFDTLAMYSQLYNAEINVIYVNKSGVDVDMESIGDKLPASVPVRYWNIPGKDIGAAIWRFALDNPIDMIVVVPKEHGFFDMLFKESPTRELTLHPVVPVLALQED